MRSLDDGRSWQVRRSWGDSSYDTWPSCVVPLTAARVVVGSGGGVLLTTDGGSRWRSIAVDVGGVSGGCRVSSTIAWVAGKSGAARTTDGGRTWRVMLETPDLDHIQFVDSRHGWAYSDNDGTAFQTSDGG